MSHVTIYVPFPDGGPLESSLYLTLFKIFVWCIQYIWTTPFSFIVMWRHLSRDHLMPVGALLYPSLYLQPFLKCVPDILGHDLDLSRSRDVIEHVTVRFAICRFYWCPIGTEPLSLTISRYSAAKPVRTHTNTHRKWLFCHMQCGAYCKMHWTDNLLFCVIAYRAYFSVQLMTNCAVVTWKFAVVKVILCSFDSDVLR